MLSRLDEFARAAGTSTATEQLQQQKHRGSQFWRLKVHGQGISRAALPLKTSGKDLSVGSLSFG